MHFGMLVRFVGVYVCVCAMGIAALVLALPHSASAQLTPEQRAQLEQQLANIEAQIRQQEALLSKKQQERTSLERDIAILDAQIERSRLSIAARDLAIAKLRGEISNKESAIGVLDQKVAAGQESLAQLIRLTRESDETSLVELALAGTLSDFFRDLDSYATLGRALDESFTEMALVKTDLTDSRAALLERQTAEEELRKIQVLERESIEAKEREKQKVLDATKGQEAAYQRLLNSQRQTAAEIRATLFNLRDSGAIPFGQAYEFAKQASAKTGVRPAVILAVLTQETNLGENVGQCLLTNSPNKGDGKGKNTGRFFSQVMKGSRDVDPFMQITAELGLDPFSMVVSCPPGYGYGGAMGPAQFIPSTWVLYKDRIAQATGNNPPNPWDARTAIFATAILMMDNGADAQSYSAERLAALRYFAGWRNATNPAYAFYGNDVMEIAERIQGQIDILQGI